MLVCTKCGRKFEEKFLLRCECGGTLFVKRNYDSFLPDPRFFDIRRYQSYLPVDAGFLPKIPPIITPVVEIDGIRFKLDYLHPTGSFKDRGTFVTIAKLKEEGIDEVVLDSSGNAALSLAFYSMISGIKAHIFLSYDAKPGKISALMNLNAKVHFVEGDRMKVHDSAVEFSKATGIPYVTHWLNPYFIEGTKTIAFEIYEEIGVPEEIFIPTGSGTALLGVWKGFKELMEMGEIDRFPKLIAVQAEGFESLCPKSPRINRLADGIAIPNPPRLEDMRRALEETGGYCISVDEDDTLAAHHWLKTRGLLVEETSATALAGYWKAKEEGIATGNSLILLTGVKR
ncbi:pyridoxal-phosphate dependent enzyme [Pyrococcus kukulkanii]|uniref:Threonine synthase n=1 Tax=Pyrococcus kukulkanii TaxID=1609559 RepID=A0A127BBH8_9EURY|nr:pyridoxal-phosphate dependent enzyme [Pyrococcus kukulkanii]AMM54545.1 threonine synthase [Pyrococcus kukulkanii]